MQKLRYEILLPLNRNDGTAQAPEDLMRTIKEITRQMGGCTHDHSRIDGFWNHEGTTFHDQLNRVLVDVDDTPESLAYFMILKTALEERFQQHSIYITRHPVEVL